MRPGLHTRLHLQFEGPGLVGRGTVLRLGCRAMQPVADTIVNKFGNHHPARRVARQPAQIFYSKRRHLAKIKIGDFITRATT